VIPQRLLRGGSLADIGWSVGREAPHLPGEPNVLSLAPGFAKRSAYFTCVHRWNELFPCGLPRLAISLSNSYYEALLVAPDKASVLKRRPQSYYKDILRKAAFGYIQPIGFPLAEPLAPLDGTASDESDEFAVGIAFDDIVPLLPPKRARIVEAALPFGEMFAWGTSPTILE
jgi:hypothetical protein